MMEILTDVQKDMLLNDAIVALKKGLSINPEVAVETDNNKYIKGACCLIGSVCVVAQGENVDLDLSNEKVIEFASKRLELDEDITSSLLYRLDSWSQFKLALGDERYNILKKEITKVHNNEAWELED